MSLTTAQRKDIFRTTVISWLHSGSLNSVTDAHKTDCDPEEVERLLHNTGFLGTVHDTVTEIELTITADAVRIA